MAKRFFDIVVSLFGLIIISPVMLVVSILIKLKTPGSVFFCQERVGRFGKPFILYKFRTMVEGNSGNTISLKGEDRITPLGAILRKSKLDELPELWNVFKGEMSLVGPRPDVAVYIGTLTGEDLRILDLRPGITSPASIKYSNEEEIVAAAPNPNKFYNEVIWPDKVRLNLNYYHNHSFYGDMLILFNTVFR